MAYYCAHITNEMEEEWEELVKKSPASGFHQTFDWARFKQWDNWDTYKIGVFEANTKKLCGGCITHSFECTSDTNFIYIPEGPILNYEDEDELFWQWRSLETALHSTVELSQKKRTTHIRMEPRIESIPSWMLLGWKKAPLNLQPRHTRVIDLALKEETILAEMKQKCRYNIRLAEKKNVQIRKASWSELPKFYKLYEETAKRDGFECKKIGFFEGLIQGMKSELALYIAESENGIPLASAIVVYFGDRATYLYGASSNENRNLMGPYALHWAIIKDAQKDNYKEYDFWGVAPSLTDEAHDWHGLSVFKAGFGGKHLNFIGAYDYVLQTDQYNDFIEKHEK
jgi:lipid II:glycine glycyltransferase (peptidoglycan interpeptide bridge formation enzyme)